MRNPEDRESSRNITGSPVDRDRLLSLMLAAERKRKHSAAKITAREAGTGPVPLSFSQERLWFLNELGLVGSAYNITMALRLDGDLNVSVLGRSFEALTRRHEILRTHLEVADGVPHQVIDAPGPFEVQHVDLSHGLDKEQRERELRECNQREQSHRFDLSKGPLLRVVLVRLAAQEHVLLLTMHHIACDGWSLGVLIRELGELYSAYVQGRAAALPDLPVQYADYAIWQRKWLQGDVLREQLDYWKQRLAGAATLLELPTDRTRPPLESFKGATLNFELPAELSRKLKALAQQEGATLFMIALASYQLLLARWSARQDIVVGVSIAGRRFKEIEDLIGVFVNTLVLRAEVTGNVTFRQLLRQVKEVTLGAYAHQDLPFEVLVKELRPERSLSAQPIFQVTLSVQNFPEEHLQMPGLAWKWAASEVASTHVDLTLYLYEKSDCIAGAFVYASDLFDADTIDRLQQSFRALLDRVVGNPDRLLQRIPALSESEARRLLVDWNRTYCPFPRSRLIHELFEEQVARSPDALACIYEQQSLTYEELNRRANQLAHYLRARGVGPDQPVGLCVERSLEMIVGLLGILKSGGAYVPLDPNYPLERRAAMLRDAAPGVVLTRRDLRGELFGSAPSIIALDSDWPQIARLPSTDLDHHANGLRSEHLAYVIYTSGSTGQPKGVMVDHRNVASLWQSLEHIYRTVLPCRRIAVNASFNFDASVKQIVQLLSGRTLVVVPQQLRWDAPRLLNYIEAQEIDGIDCTPSQLKTWITAGLLEIGRSRLRMALIGGEAIDAELWSSLAQCRDKVFFNVYGPTESTVDTTYARIEGTVSHIGRPMENRTVYILDPHGQPVPLGVAGEMHIGGAGIARGYLNRPVLTAERFVADPFSDDPGSRLYKTGDLAKWRSDGVIEYLGRNDHQVKIRGFRIELGEIGAQLARHPSVKEAVVTTLEDVTGEKRLVAYVIPDVSSAPAPDSTELRDHLRTVLPDYMVPSSFVTMERFPLTPNGKLDLRALPPPQLDLRNGDDYEPPRGSVETALAEIWQELLGLQRVGREDNFFELGGHSLLGVKLVSKVSERLKCVLSVVAIFQHPTIAQLADVVESLQQVNAVSQRTIQCEPTLAPRERRDRAPLAFSQLAHWHTYGLAKRPAIRQIASATRIAGPLHTSLVHEVLGEIVQRHDALRTQIVNFEDGPSQVISAFGRCELQLQDLSRTPESAWQEEISRSIEEFILEPVDLSSGALFGARVLRLRDDDHVLLLVMEHIISDATSMGLLRREVFTAYTQATQRQARLLPQIPIQFADYAAWQSQVSSAWMAQHSAHWARMARYPLLKFPQDRMLEATVRPGAGTIPIHIGQRTKQRLQQWCQLHRTTLPIALFSAYAALVLRWCGASRAVILYAVDGRDRPEVENTIGYFASTLYLRMDLEDADRFVDLTKMAAQEYIESHEHADHSYWLAQVPSPEFTRNTAFNWIPQGADMRGVATHTESGSQLRCAPVRFNHPMMKTLEMTHEPGVALHDSDQQINGYVAFPLARFSEALMARFAANYSLFVEMLLERPEARVKDVQLL